MSDNDRMVKHEHYEFSVPLFKSQGSNDGKRIVEGIASTEAWDGQDEQILQDGLNFQPFLQNGYVNWNHNGNPQSQIGVPLEGGIVTNNGLPAFWIKARLFDDIPQADYAWQLIKALERLHQDGGPERHLGWSVEGAVLEKENGRIKKSIVRQVALTHEPVNAETMAIAKSFAQFAKSLGAGTAITTPNVSSPDGSQHTYDPTKVENLDGAGSRKECEGKTGDDLQDCKDGITDTNLKRGGKLFDTFFKSPQNKIFKSWDDMLVHMVVVNNVSPEDALDFVTRIRKTAGNY